jgi:hypothetical protein
MPTVTYICQTISVRGLTGKIREGKPHLVTTDPHRLQRHQICVRRWGPFAEIHVLDRKIEDENGNVSYPDSVGMLLRQAEINVATGEVAWRPDPHPRGRRL